jgi:hypothetical protein
MGEAWCTYRGEERSIQILVENLRERGHLQDLGIDRRIILK